MKQLFLFLIAASLCLASCDEGRIPEKTMRVDREGRVLKLTGTFSGIRNWADGYSVVVAGFPDNSQSAELFKALPVNQDDGTEVVLTLSGIPSNVTSLHLCVVDRLSNRIVSFASVEEDELAATEDTVRMDVGTLDVGMYSAIQSQVFDAKCIACHGGNAGTAAAGLFLTEGKSYEALVNKASHVNAAAQLVEPNDAENSFLYLVLTRNGDTQMHHVDMFSENEQPLLKLIEIWINAGALP